MPFEYDWKLIIPECVEGQAHDFLDSQKTYRTSKSQDERCQICFDRRNPDQMCYQIFQCKSKACNMARSDKVCQWHIKILSCNEQEDRPARCVVYQHSEHHTQLRSPTRAELNLGMKRTIRNALVERAKPNAILNRLITNYKLTPERTDGLLRKVQNFCTYYRKQQLNETAFVDDMEELIQTHRFRSGLDDYKAFVFGFTTDANCQPSLGTGTDEEPVVVGFSTGCMVRRLSYAATNVLHIDATYKTNTSRFPLVVIGVSDMGRHFHPVAFFLSSDCKTTQYKTAITALLNIFTAITGETPVLKFVMADAEVAQRNSMEEVVAEELTGNPPVDFLMCYFHVMANVRKYTNGMDPAIKKVIYRHIYRIHYSRSFSDVATRTNEAVACWAATPGCEKVTAKFCDQWLSGRFTRWFCVPSPPGHAKTNNPCEQFNREFKRDYTKGFALPINTLFKELLSAAHDKSVKMPPFAMDPEPAADQVARYKRLRDEMCLNVAIVPRATISFMFTGNQPLAHTFYVVQSGLDRNAATIASGENAGVGGHDSADNAGGGCADEDGESYESDTAEEEIEVAEQPAFGWTVDVNAGTCGCRTWIKHAYCVHLIACRVGLRLPVVGLKPPRAVFVTKGKTTGK